MEEQRITEQRITTALRPDDFAQDFGETRNYRDSARNGSFMHLRDLVNFHPEHAPKAAVDFIRLWEDTALAAKMARDKRVAAYEAEKRRVELERRREGEKRKKALEDGGERPDMAHFAGEVADKPVQEPVEAAPEAPQRPADGHPDLQAGQDTVTGEKPPEAALEPPGEALPQIDHSGFDKPKRKHRRTRVGNGQFCG